MDFPTYENPTAYHAQAVLDNTDLKALSVAPAFTGVASGCVVSANATMGVAIASGTILINGVSRTTAGGTSVVSAASVGDRRDIIYATWSGSAVVFTTADGTPATAGWTFGTQGTPPIKPTLPDNAVLLAEVYVVGSGATPTTVITSSEIVDKRCIVALDATKLPLAGGTMSGAIAMGSNRITGLPTPGASTDPLIASQSTGTPSSLIHAGGTYPIKSWNADPANSPNFTSQTATMSSGIHAFTAISIPYAMTLNQIWVWHTTGATAGTSGAFYGMGIYSTTGTLLASTGNQVSSGFIGSTGALAWALSAPYTIQPGNYMIGFLWYAGTGGVPVTPILGKPATATAAQININCPTLSSGKLDQRCCVAGTGQTSLYSPMNVTPTTTNANYWTAVA